VDLPKTGDEGDRGSGAYPGPGAKANQIIEHNQKQLAAYLRALAGRARLR
jgi:hypothetical protein